ncbi:hypothetical protein KSF_047950 [Reticulibacter mediterranei]|uniref:SRPBCC family protein n=1 Tax=Reticulibacter mediterranei TaxID=2778369 RepID=A0A8J3N1Y2_9CHLR|nr:SRPBCC family protein [Reticulibacter mediterranei]GHO94747.1 hypothetical protein KSF_047950 [Reticulibacter mediterranei]
MARIAAKAAATIDARPDDVYATFADYKNSHPHVLPETLYDLQVEEGGYGAGTVFRCKSKVMGVERTLYMRSSEPEPGHVLMERDIDSVQDTITTFTVTPIENGQKSHVEIATVMNSSPGLMGLIERLLIPRFLNPSYQQEIRNVEAFLQKKRAAHV